MVASIKDVSSNKKEISREVETRDVKAPRAVYDVLMLDANSRKVLATVRSLGKQGLRIAALTTSDELPVPAFSSRWCQKTFICPAEEGTQEYLLYLESILDVYDIKVLIPSSDGTIDLVRRNRARLARRVRIALADEAALHIAVNKELTLEVAQHLGLGVPHGIAITSTSELEKALDEIGLPAVVKPAESWIADEQGDHRQRVSVRLVTTREEAREAVEELTCFGHTVLLQQFLSGRHETVALFYAGGQVYARFAYWSKRRDGPLGGGSALSQSIVYPADIGEQAERLVREIGLEGYSHIQFRRGSDGKPYLLEINARLNGALEHGIMAGVDFPRLLYQWASGEQIDTIEGYITGLWMRYLWGDLEGTVATLRQHGRPGVPSPLRAVLDFGSTCLLPMRYDYVDWSDPRPIWVAVSSAVGKEIKRFGQRLFHKDR